MATFGERLRDVMESQGVGVRQLGRNAGVDASNISKILHGAQSPTESTVRSLAEALGVPVWQLMGGRGSEWSSEAMAAAQAVERLPADMRGRVIPLLRELVAAFGASDPLLGDDEPVSGGKVLIPA